MIAVLSLQARAFAFLTKGLNPGPLLRCSIVHSLNNTAIIQRMMCRTSFRIQNGFVNGRCETSSHRAMSPFLT